MFKMRSKPLCLLTHPHQPLSLGIPSPKPSQRSHLQPGNLKHPISISVYVKHYVSHNHTQQCERTTAQILQLGHTLSPRGLSLFTRFRIQRSTRTTTRTQLAGIRLGELTRKHRLLAGVRESMPAKASDLRRWVWNLWSFMLWCDLILQWLMGRAKESIVFLFPNGMILQLVALKRNVESSFSRSNLVCCYMLCSSYLLSSSRRCID